MKSAASGSGLTRSMALSSTTQPERAGCPPTAETSSLKTSSAAARAMVLPPVHAPETSDTAVHEYRRGLGGPGGPDEIGRGPVETQYPGGRGGQAAGKP